MIAYVLSVCLSVSVRVFLYVLMCPGISALWSEVDVRRLLSGLCNFFSRIFSAV